LAGYQGIEHSFVTRLPKTRSGKIMRRLLKAIAKGDEIGDISTLENKNTVSEVQVAFEEVKQSIKKNHTK
jgi:acetyl-CoA synthetase